jgi:cytochrome c oxidase subunit 2
MFDWLGLPRLASAHGGQIDQLIGVIHIIMFVLFIGWGAFFAFILMKFRKGAHPKADYTGVKSHFSSYIEGAVAVVEVILLVGFSIPLWAKVVVSTPSEAESTVVRVVAQQFQWNCHYAGPDGKFGRVAVDLMDDQTNPVGLDREDPAAKDDVWTINQLHLPVDKPALIYLSTKDVIHSFFLPEMRVKQDAIPGMRIPVSWTPTVTGEYEIACAQLCGLGHYRMRGYMTIHTPEAYQAWMDEKQAELNPAPES